MSVFWGGHRVLRYDPQRGFALVELVITLAITCMIAIWAANTLVREVEDSADHAAGRWLLEIRGALDKMLMHHFDAFAMNDLPLNEEGQPIYADPSSPTLEELKAQGHLSLAFPTVSVEGLQAIVRIIRGPNCPGEACRLEALAYTRHPWGRRSQAGQADSARIAGMLMAMEGQGGSVSQWVPTRLQGATFDFSNPLTPGMVALPVGTVAIWTGLDVFSMSQYLRRRDKRDPEFLGDVSVKGTLTSAGRLVAGEYLKLGAVVVEGDVCPETGLVARDSAGQILSCVDGHWSVPGGFGGAFSYHTTFHCSTKLDIAAPNPRTGKCTCPPGFKAVRVSVRGTDTGEKQYTRTVPYGPMIADRGMTFGYVCAR